MTPLICNRKGITLLEILMAMFIFSIVLTVVVTLFVTGFGSYSKGTQESFLYRGAVTALDMTAGEIRQCRTIYDPNGGTVTKATLSAGYAPILGTNTPFIFKYTGLNGIPQVLAYTLDSSSLAIVRLLYDPGFDPKKSKTWILQRQRPDLVPEADPNGPLQVLIAQSVQSLLFTYSTAASGTPEFIQINFTLYPYGAPSGAQFPLESQVGIQKGF